MLEEYALTPREISHILRISERDVSDHLDHVRKTLHKAGRELIVTPSECEQCGFVFKKRERLSKPGKCPVCHSSLIKPPLFSIPQAEEASVPGS
jgi:transcriptional regulator